jgi:hypothetical protein
MGVFDDLPLGTMATPQDAVPVPQSGGMFGDLPLNAMTTPDPGAMKSFGMGAADMLSFGLLDETEALRQASGTAGSALDFVPFAGAAKGLYDVKIKQDPVAVAAYNKGLQDARTEMATGAEAHPWATTAGKFAGGVPYALALPGSPQGASLAQQMLWYGGQGAGLGGLYGFGSGEGDAIARAQHAIPDAMWGAGMGAAIPAAAQIGSGIYNTLRGRIGTVPGYSRQAVTNMRQHVDADGGVDAIQQRMRTLGPDAMLGEAGPNLTMASEAVAKTPGPGAKIMTDAVDERALRLDGGAMQQRVDRVIGSQSSRTQVADVLQGVRDQASPLYESVKSMKGQYDTSGLAKLLDAQIKSTDGAISEMLEKVKGLKIFSQKGPANIEQLHAAREALDQMITSGFQNGNAKGAIAAKTYRNAIDKALKQFPDFAQADAMWSAQVRGGKAFDAGLSIFEGGKHPINGSPDQFAKWWSKAKPEEKDAVRVGIRNAYDKLMGTKSAPMSNMPEVAEAQAQTRAVSSQLSKPWTQQKLEIALGKNEFQNLKNLADSAQTAQNFRQVIKGGARSAQQTTMKEMYPGATGDPGWATPIGQRTAVGTVMELGARGLNKIFGNTINAGRERTLGDAARLLTQKEADAMRFLDQLQKMNAVQQQGQAVGGILNVLPFRTMGAPDAITGARDKRQERLKARQSRGQ